MPRGWLERERERVFFVFGSRDDPALIARTSAARNDEPPVERVRVGSEKRLQSVQNRVDCACCWAADYCSMSRFDLLEQQGDARRF
jgi:hypothetical protein